LIITPENPTTALNGQILFDVGIGMLGDQPPVLPYHWSLAEENGGTLAEFSYHEVTYTAPMIPGTYHLVVTDSASPPLRSEIAIAVTGGYAFDDQSWRANFLPEDTYGGNQSATAIRTVAQTGAGLVAFVDGLDYPHVQLYAMDDGVLGKTLSASGAFDPATVTAITAHPEGGFVVTQDDPSGPSSFVRLSATGTVVSSWLLDDPPNSCISPSAICMAEDGSVYIVDASILREHQIHHFAADGTALGQWGEEGSGAGQLTFSAGIACANGKVYIADRGNHRIQCFSEDGTFLFEWGAYGRAVGQFNAPTQLAVDPNGRVYVLDTGNSRVQVFTPTGQYFAHWGGGMGVFSNLTGITALSDGRILVVDSPFVQRFRPVE